MRLGNYPCELNPDSYLNEIYGISSIKERHRHRYEVNPEFKNQFESFSKCHFSETSHHHDYHRIIMR